MCFIHTNISKFALDSYVNRSGMTTTKTLKRLKSSKKMVVCSIYYCCLQWFSFISTENNRKQQKKIELKKTTKLFEDIELICLPFVDTGSCQFPLSFQVVHMLSPNLFNFISAIFSFYIFNYFNNFCIFFILISIIFNTISVN